MNQKILMPPPLENSEASPVQKLSLMQNAQPAEPMEKKAAGQRKPPVNLRHGHAYNGKRTKEYKAWVDMKRRCLSESCKSWKDYGGRGIMVFQPWIKSFVSFLNDVGFSPKGNLLDRINNDGNYEPGNVRWATPMESAANTRLVRIVTLNGITANMSQHSRRMGISTATIRKRLKNGLLIDQSAKEAK